MSDANSVSPPTAAGCSYDSDGPVTRVTLHPSLSDVKWDQIESIGSNVESRLDQEKPKKVIFDISGLTYMGSAMVALVVRWWKKVEAHDGQSVVAVHDPNVLEVLKLASLDEYWTIVPTAEAAYKKLGATAPVGVSSTGVGAASGASSGHSVSADDEGPVWPGLFAAGGAGVALVGFLLGLLNVVDRTTAVKIAIIAAVVGAVVGLVGLVLCAGKRRSLAVLFLIVSVVAGGLAVGVLGVDGLRDQAETTETEDSASTDEAEPEADTKPAEDDVPESEAESDDE